MKTGIMKGSTLLLVVLIAKAGLTQSVDAKEIKPLPEEPKKAYDVRQIKNVLKKRDKVFIPQVQMNFVTESEFKASRNNTSLTTRVVLSGLSDPDYQEISDKVLVMAQEKFKELGYEIIPYENYKENEHYLKLAKDASGESLTRDSKKSDRKSFGSQHEKIVFADGRPPILWDGQIIGGPSMKLSKVAKDMDGAIAVAFNFTPFFATYSSDINSWSTQGYYGHSSSTTEIELEALPRLFFYTDNAVVSMVNDKMFMGSMYQKNIFGSDEDFIKEMKLVDESGYEVKDYAKNQNYVYQLIVDKEVYKSTLLTEVEKHMDYIFQRIKEEMN